MLCEIHRFYKDDDFPDADILPSSAIDILRIVFDGMKQEKKVYIKYRDSYGDISERMIFPEVIFTSYQAYYVYAYCYLRKEPRTFRINGMISADLTEFSDTSYGLADDFAENGIPWNRGSFDFDDVIEKKEQQKIEKEKSLLLFEHIQKNDLNSVIKDIICGADVNYDMAGFTPLRSAVRMGNFDMVKHLLLCGAEAEKEDRYGLTPLHHAVREQNIALAKYFVEDLCCHIQPDDFDGLAPLHHAAATGNIELVKYLVKHGANVNFQKKKKITPLMYCICKAPHAVAKHLKIIKFLLKNGANINAADYEGRSALFYATKNVSHKMIKFLLANGANVNIADKFGSTPLHCMLRYLEDKEKIDVLNTELFTEEIRLLCEAGADVNAADKRKITPLMLARGGGFDILLEYGADINAADYLGRSVILHHADSIEDIKKLASLGADVYASDNSGDNLLMRTKYDLEHISFLVNEFGFSVNSRNQYKTILHNVVAECDLEAVRFLIEHGADVNAVDAMGKTAEERNEESIYYEAWLGDAFEIGRILEAARCRDKK